jgi:hypothetical protein
MDATGQRHSTNAAVGEEGSPDPSEQKRARLLERLRVQVLPGIALCGIATGGLLALVSLPVPADAVWAATVAVMLVPLTWSEIGRASCRERV